MICNIHDLQHLVIPILTQQFALSFPFSSTLIFRILSRYLSREHRIGRSIVLNSRWHFASARALLRKYISSIAICKRDNKWERKKKMKMFRESSDCSAMFPTYLSRRARVPVTWQMRLSQLRSIRHVRNKVRLGQKLTFSPWSNDLEAMISPISHLAFTRNARAKLELFLLAINHKVLEVRLAVANYITLHAINLHWTDLRASFYSQ